MRIIQKKMLTLLIVLVLVMLIVLDTGISQTNTQNKLEIQTVSQINETYFFTVLITSQMNPIENVTVLFNGITNRTNFLGLAGFFAPRVSSNQNNTYQISASKAGYISNTTNITVVFVPQLFPFVDSAQITEETWFIITTYDEAGQSIENVTILFNEQLFFTDENGMISILAPSVSKIRQYTISASKTGYLNYSILITVHPTFSYENIIGMIFAIIICIGIVIFTFFILFKKKLKIKRINKK